MSAEPAVNANAENPAAVSYTHLGARRIVLELAGKLILSDGQTDELPLSQGIVWKPQVLDALTSLGWSEKDASAAIDAYVQHNPAAETEPVGVALRGVLASLGLSLIHI